MRMIVPQDGTCVVTDQPGYEPFLPMSAFQWVASGPKPYPRWAHNGLSRKFDRHYGMMIRSVLLPWHLLQAPSDMASAMNAVSPLWINAGKRPLPKAIASDV
jgi:hypothetical protein